MVFLTPLEALRKREIPVLGVVFSDADTEEDERLVHDNMQTIKEIGLVSVLGRLQRHQENEQAKTAFVPVAQAILEHFGQRK